MVDALNEIYHVLVPGGFILDARPLADGWRVEVASLREIRRTGRVIDLPMQINGDVAAQEALKNVEARGWFKRETEELFPFFYSWDTPSEMEEFVHEDWADFITLDDETKRATRFAWASADGDSRVRVRVEILISRWRKL